MFLARSQRRNQSSLRQITQDHRGLIGLVLIGVGAVEGGDPWRRQNVLAAIKQWETIKADDLVITVLLFFFYLPLDLSVDQPVLLQHCNIWTGCYIIFYALFVWCAFFLCLCSYTNDINIHSLEENCITIYSKNNRLKIMSVELAYNSMESFVRWHLLSIADCCSRNWMHPLNWFRELSRFKIYCFTAYLIEGAACISTVL